MLRASICIPSFNHGRFLQRALDSALSQTERQIEVLLIDDGSTDDTLEIARRIADPRFQIYRNPQRLGLGGNFNRCLELARAPLIKILCDDDVLEQNAIELLARALDDNSSALFATSKWTIIDENDAVLDEIALCPGADNNQLVGLVQIVRSSLLYRNRIGAPSSVLLRASAVADRRFNPRYKQMVDWEFWLQLLTAGDLVYVPTVLSAFRRHPGGQSARQRGQAARDLFAMSIDPSTPFARLSAQFRGYIKLLQLLCAGRAASAAALNAWSGDFAEARENALLAARALFRAPVIL